MPLTALYIVAVALAAILAAVDGILLTVIVAAVAAGLFVRCALKHRQPHIPHHG